MTAKAFASLLNARKVGKGRWMAYCPAHPDRHPSLSIAEGRKVPVVMRCMSAGCDTRDILEALGMKWGDLFDGKASPEVQARIGFQEMRARLERQLGLVAWLGAIENGKRAYWAAAERRIKSELDHVRCRLEPDKIIREFQNRQFRRRVAREGLEKMLEEVWECIK
jgi:hypothetical protein